MKSNILKPIKAMDEEVLRQYSKVAKNWEGKGRNIYHLANVFRFSGVVGSTGSLIIYPQIFPINAARGFLQGGDIGINTGNLMLGDKNSVSNGATTKENPLIENLNKIQKLIRLPSFVGGVGFMGKGAYEIASSIKTGDYSQMNEALFDLSFGYSLFGHASSIYLKDRDPKLLDKVPFWKKAKDKLVDKVKSIDWNPSPQPDAIPVPFENYSRNIENYLLEEEK